MPALRPEAPNNAGMFDAIVDHASRRYRVAGITQWQIARGKLRGDPVYRAVWEGPWLRGGTVIDLGCGKGLMLSLFASARELGRLHPGENAGEASRLIGIEVEPCAAALARRALQRHAEILTLDARESPLPACRTVLIFDVLHVLSAADQEAVLARIARSLGEGGTLLLRDADAAAGWRFACVRIVNRTRAFLRGGSARDYCFRTADGWRELLGRHGFSVALLPMSAGTPFGNVLFVATRTT